MSRHRGTQAATLLLCLTTGAAIAQTPVPVDQEPQHHIAFENRFVRVLDVTFPPGYVTRWHEHDRDNVSVRITTGPTKTDVPGTDSASQESPVGRVAYYAGTPPYSHRITNVGQTTIRILDVELLLGDGPSTAPPATPAGHTLVVDNERLRALRITLQPGETLPAHTHPAGWLDVVVRGTTPGSFAWKGASTAVPAITGAAGGTEIVELQPKSRTASTEPFTTKITK